MLYQKQHAINCFMGLQETYNVEISGGLGPSVGKVFRVGIMGYNATDANVALVIEAFRDGMQKQGRL